MDITLPTPLLGGISPQTFMRRHWQKKPLLVRQAVPGGVALIAPAQLFALAGAEGVESRLIARKESTWTLRHGPFKRTAIPALKQREWTLLLQGLDLHLPAARDLLDRFRFIPDARVDDLMISFATDGGGVGPHVDSYDVFLLQTQGRRRWRIGRVAEPELVPDMPLKILANFSADHEWLLEPGDMLYLPPGWAHDGVADGTCTTCSIGFRAPRVDELGREVLQRMLDAVEPDETAALYRDPRQAATDTAALIPLQLRACAEQAVARLAGDADSLGCALGEILSEPKPGVWFDPPEPDGGPPTGIALHMRTRMLYDERHVFINGESFRAGGRDAKLMRRLADRRELSLADVKTLSADASGLLTDWMEAGWVQRSIGRQSAIGTGDNGGEHE